MYNTATRMPSPWMSPLNEVWNIDKYSNASESWLLNPTAEKPEILTAYESQNIFMFGNTILSFNLYYQELNNFIAWFSPFTNTGNFSGKGAEMTFMSEINSNLKLWANASYNDAEFDNTSISNNSYGLAKTIANYKGEMMSVPFFTANIGTDLHYRKFYFSPRIKYLYHMPAYDALNSSFFYIENRAYLNVTLSWANIMDKNYYNSAYWQEYHKQHRYNADAISIDDIQSTRSKL